MSGATERRSAPAAVASGVADDVVELILRRVSGELLSVVDIAEACNISAGTVSGWIENGDLPAVDFRSGKAAMYRVSRTALEGFLRARTRRN